MANRAEDEGRTDGAAGPRGRARPVSGTGAGEPLVAVVSQDGPLIERAADAVAAAGCTAAVCPDGRAEAVGRARALLLGTDAAEQVRRGGIARQSQALIIGGDGREAALWRAAGELGTAGAVALPSGSAWLVRWLHDRVHGAIGRSGPVVAVIGCAGGVGASTLAAATAVAAAVEGLRPLLIDAHPGPAGVDLLLGEPDGQGHWPRFAGIRGFLDPETLAGLPVYEGVRCLGWSGRSEVPLWQGALDSVVVAAARDHDLVVVDAGQHGAALPELPRRSRPVLLVPASWRGALAAQARLAEVRAAFDEAPLVVLRDIGGSSDPGGWGRAFDGHEVLHLGFDPAAIDDEERGRPPGTRPRAPLTGLARQLLAAVAGGRAAA